MVCFQNGPFYAELQNKDYYKSINPFKVFNTQSTTFFQQLFPNGISGCYVVINAVVKFELENLMLWTGVILIETEGWLQSMRFGNQYFDWLIIPKTA